MKKLGVIYNSTADIIKCQKKSVEENPKAYFWM